MLSGVTRENFNQLLDNFSTTELENLISQFPYFQQAHLLLTKKYHEQKHTKFDEQLQMAAIYTQDKDLLYSLFHEVNASATTDYSPTERIITETCIGTDIQVKEIKSDSGLRTENANDSKFLLPTEEELTAQISPTQEQALTEPANKPPVVDVMRSRSFDDWLAVFSTPASPEFLTEKSDALLVKSKSNDELENLIQSNLSFAHVYQMMEEETQYSKGLDKFIEEQKLKRRQDDKLPLKSANENEIAPEMITETMAKVYEMQKKYSKAIRAYELLSLKYPEKSDLFAARINYLKNII